MPLSWNEIKGRALDFSHEWNFKKLKPNRIKHFWTDFFDVFGISRHRVSTFLQMAQSFNPVHQKRVEADDCFHLLWKGVIYISHQSDDALFTDTWQSIKDALSTLPEKEQPPYILVSNSQDFKLFNNQNNTYIEFQLPGFIENINHFGFLAGYQVRSFKELDPINREAAELIGDLHDKLKAIGYTGHSLEVLLIRLVFIFFADHSNIFEKGIFYDYLQTQTTEDGSDLASQLFNLFQVLNTPVQDRSAVMDETLKIFPYINGKLFEESLPATTFNQEIRSTISDCCLLDWGRISPAIFGSMFQNIMDDKVRRSLGAYYTSEKNILKLIKPLFLDKLWKEFNRGKASKARLLRLHENISNLRFLDPACGCGNFLIIAYRELRLLEIAIIKELLFRHMKLREEVAASTDIPIKALLKCNVDRFYGIEYEEFPCQIAQLAMWLMDHQMNMQASQIIGTYYARLPLSKRAIIIHGNALRLDWQHLLGTIPPKNGALRFDYILGNPPFVGKQLQNNLQKEDMNTVFAGVNGSGVLDYVAGWYIKAAQYMKEYSGHGPEQGEKKKNGQNNTKAAFVSTNSITQGEQVGILWNELYGKYEIKIHFAHRTFKWSSEAKGNAAVHVVIIGFANYNIPDKLIYDYERIKGEAHETTVKNINPYLIEGRDKCIIAQPNPICKVPKMLKGSQPTDGGHFLFTDKEKIEFLKQEPGAAPFVKPFISAHEYLNGQKRWCLWLTELTDDRLDQLPLVKARVEGVKIVRLKSSKSSTVKWAAFPAQFTENRQPTTNYILIPSHSSENRKYIPLGFMSKDDILNNSCFAVQDASLYQFGILTSEMHMVWVKNICGRIKSDLRYSNTLNFNNFPWPENPKTELIKAVENAAKEILDVRAHFLSPHHYEQVQNTSLATLYHPVSMPVPLIKAHEALDKAVDLCYRRQPFPNESKRMAFLFDLHDKYMQKH